MHILHVIANLQRAAGTSVFCGEVSNALAEMGHDVTIAVVDPERKDKIPLDKRVRLISIASLFKGKNCGFDIVHIHALWSPVLHRASKWARSLGIPVVWSPHGMLTSWAMHHKWLKKQIGWWLYQRLDLCEADLLHATADSEVQDIRLMGLKNDVIIVPLGVHLEQKITSHNGAKILLFVSRIQKKKGLPNLIKAWATLPPEIKHNWKVRLVGPDQENHTAEIFTLCKKLGVAEDFEFVGPKYGEDLQQEYANANLFILPSFSENFGSVIIEALGCKVPVITTKGTPWSELENQKCGWWIDIGIEPIKSALSIAMSLPDEELCEMGARGQQFVRGKYTWQAVANTLLAGYASISKKGESNAK